MGVGVYLARPVLQRLRLSFGLHALSQQKGSGQNAVTAFSKNSSENNGIVFEF